MFVFVYVSGFSEEIVNYFSYGIPYLIDKIFTTMEVPGKTFLRKREK